MVKLPRWEYTELWEDRNFSGGNSFDLGRANWELVAVNWVNKNDIKKDGRWFEHPYEDVILIQHRVFRRQLLESIE